MRLAIRFLGLDLLSIEASTDEPGEPGEDDTARDLSGGELGSYRVEVGPTDRYMGFTNGREVEP